MSYTANFIESIARNYGVQNHFSKSIDYSIKETQPTNSNTHVPVIPVNNMTSVSTPVIPVTNIQPQASNLDKKDDTPKEAFDLLEQYKTYYCLYEQSLNYKKNINKSLDELERKGQSYSSEYKSKFADLENENRQTNRIDDKLQDLLSCLNALGYTTKIDFSLSRHVLVKI